MSRSEFLPLLSPLVQVITTSFKYKICALFLCLLGANAQLAAAAEIIIEPIYTYVNGNNKASSISSIISTHNAAADIRRDNCFAGFSAQCNTHKITSYWPSAAAVTYNGIPHLYDIQTEQTSYWKDANGQFQSSTITPVAVQSIYLDVSCPQSFELVVNWTDDTKIRTAYCRKVEQQSCAVEGNPINVGTANKFEHEVDYSTADGLLKIERHYVDQRTGWMLDFPQKIVEVNPGGKVQAGLAYSYTTVYKRYSLDAANPTSLKEYPHVHYFHYYNPLPQTAVYLNQGRQLYRYLETASGFLGEGPQAQKTHLSRVDPTLSQGAAWKLIRANGDISYFGSNGALQRTDFAKGGSLAYVYDNDRLISKSDNFGRQISYTYDTYGRITSITLPDEQEIIYEYAEDEESLHFMQVEKVTWPNGEGISYLYNEPAHVAYGADAKKMLTGKLDSLADRVGTYKYNAANKAVLTEGALGVLKREIQHSHYSAQVTNGLGSQTTYNFGQTLADGTRLLTSTSQPAGSGCAASTQSATYSTDGLLTKKTEFNGNITLYGYDTTTKLEDRRVEGLKGSVSNTLLNPSATLPAGARKISTQWHSEQRKAVKIAEPKLITTSIYNGDVDPFNNQQIASCTPNGIVVRCRKVQQATTDHNGASGFSATLDNTLAPREWLYTYNAFGQVLTLRRSPTAVPDYTIEYYDTTTTQWTTGDRKSMTNALGQVTHFDHYDPNGRLLQMTDANGVETHFTYDVRGRLTSQSIDRAFTTHTYDLNGNRIGSVLPNGVAITYHYDAAKRLTAIENALGDKIHYEYDVENNLRFERITNASDTLTYMKEHVYDALSRLQNTLDSQGHTTTYLYDASGNLTGEQDAKQQQTNHLFDALNQHTSTTDPLNGKTEYTYDGRGHVTQVKDPKGLITTYSYNAFDDLTQQISPDTGTTTFSYDNAGNRTSATDSRNVVVNYTYDALNRLTGIEYPASPTENITYTYDDTANGNPGIGRLTGISSAIGSIQYTYNPQGLITAKQVTHNNQTRTTTYSYDAAGQLTGITYPTGRIVTYTRDTAGRISGMTTRASSGATEYALLSNLQYLPFGPANAYTYGNGLTLNHDYDQDYRLQGIEVSGINPVLERDYSYDPVNNITAIINPLHTNKNQSFGYDALNRLTAPRASTVCLATPTMRWVTA